MNRLVVVQTAPISLCFTFRRGTGQYALQAVNALFYSVFFYIIKIQPQPPVSLIFKGSVYFF